MGRDVMMMLSEAAAAVGGRVQGSDVAFSTVSSDTRTLQAGALFVALRGERYDGNVFLEAALRRGAVAALASAAAGAPAGLPLLLVNDTRAALGKLAAHWRARLDIPLVAVTGSNGKTTVKEMIACVLREQHGPAQALATEGNLNNDIGVPLTLLRLRPAHRAAVVELGMNHPGETAYLAKLAAPTVAVVNNAQREHQEFMKSVADVAREHGAAIAALGAAGTAVINAEDAYAPYWRSVAQAAQARVSDFALAQQAAVSAQCMPTASGSSIELRTPAGRGRVELQAAGRHNVMNALAAAAAGLAAGAGLDAVMRGLAGFRPVQGRMQRKPGRGAAVLIDDSYNANPDSVRAAVDVLAAEPGRKVLVLGDMGEVGDQGPAFHEEVGAYARQRGIDRLLATGDAAADAVRAFGDGASHYRRVEDLIEAAGAEASGGATLLVKGSRFMRMERVVQALAGEARCS